MRGLQLIAHNTKINFVGMRKIAYITAIFIVIGSALALMTKGLNLGIDFSGGILLEIKTKPSETISTIRQQLNPLNLGEIKLQEFGSANDILIRIQNNDKSLLSQDQIVQHVKKTLSQDVDYRRIEVVGPKVSDDLIHSGLMAIACALFGMLVYIWVRFEWQYGLCGIIALVHDAIAVMGFYAVSGLEFNETAFAAILTTIGYSINDSVVIYDRLRENILKYQNKSIPDLVNLSANETLSRTLLTSGTTLIALLALSIFGGAVIRNFSLPILVGILVGTASSIYLSANLLVHFNLRRGDPLISRSSSK